MCQHCEDLSVLPAVHVAPGWAQDFLASGLGAGKGVTSFPEESEIVTYAGFETLGLGFRVHGKKG